VEKGVVDFVSDLAREIEVVHVLLLLTMAMMIVLMIVLMIMLILKLMTIATTVNGYISKFDEEEGKMSTLTRRTDSP
jgi:hypothetical protein